MKAFIWVLILLGKQQVYSHNLSTSFVRGDSIPSQQSITLSNQRYRPQFASNPEPTDFKKRSTILVNPAKSHLGNEILLPIGVIENTILLSSGDTTLLLDEDYVVVPDANRIRILNEDVVASKFPLRISYERLIVQSKL